MWGFCALRLRFLASLPPLTLFPEVHAGPNSQHDDQAYPIWNAAHQERVAGAIVVPLERTAGNSRMVVQLTLFIVCGRQCRGVAVM